MENGLRISITRDGMEFLIAVGSLMIENVDGTAQAGDPSANVVTKDQLVALFDGLELADTATQKEVRTALQQVISKFKGLVAPAVAVAAMAASAAVTPYTAWEDVPPQDSVSSVAAAAGMATTNDVCNIVTNEVHSFGDWVEEWDPPYYGTVYSFSGPYYEGGETWSGFYHPKKGMGVDMSFTAAGGEFATRLVFVGDAGGTSFTVTLTRSHVAKNALGLAMAKDLEKMSDHETVTNVVRKVVNAAGRYVWDKDLEVCYRLNAAGGFLDLGAVTNVDVTLPENWAALEAIENEWGAK